MDTDFFIPSLTSWPKKQWPGRAPAVGAAARLCSLSSFISLVGKDISVQLNKALWRPRGHEEYCEMHPTAGHKAWQGLEHEMKHPGAGSPGRSRKGKVSTGMDTQTLPSQILILLWTRRSPSWDPKSKHNELSASCTEQPAPDSKRK